MMLYGYQGGLVGRVVEDRDGIETVQGLAKVVLCRIPSTGDFSGGDVVAALLDPLLDAGDVDVVVAGADEYGFDNVAERLGPPYDGGAGGSGVGAFETKASVCSEVTVDGIVDDPAGGRLQFGAVGVAQAFGDGIGVVEGFWETVSVVACPGGLASSVGADDDQ